MKVTKKTIVQQLEKLGYTKYRIAQELGVSWNAVDNWGKGWAMPKPENYDNLITLLTRAELERGK